MYEHMDALVRACFVQRGPALCGLLVSQYKLEAAFDSAEKKKCLRRNNVPAPIIYECDVECKDERKRREQMLNT